MIKVNVLVKGNHVTKVNIIGHADYDEYGKDIVCSSVSSIVTTTVNGILKLDKDALFYNQDKDVFEIEVLKNDITIDTLVINMIDLLKQLSKDYPKNIQVKED